MSSSNFGTGANQLSELTLCPYFSINSKTGCLRVSFSPSSYCIPLPSPRSSASLKCRVSVPLPPPPASGVLGDSYSWRRTWLVPFATNPNPPSSQYDNPFPPFADLLPFRRGHGGYVPPGLTNTDHLSNMEAALECKHDALITLELPLTSVCVREEE